MSKRNFGVDMWGKVWLRIGNNVVYFTRDKDGPCLKPGNMCSPLISFMGRIKWGICPRSETRDAYTKAFDKFFPKVVA